MDAHKDRIAPGGGFSFAPRAPEPLAEQINALIDRALEEDNAKQKPRGYLGGSRLGLACHRQLAYEYFEARANLAAFRAMKPEEARAPHPFKGRTIRRFRMGHWHEDETVAWLRLAGFEILTHKPDGGQFGFGVAPDPETGDPRLAGHVDGIILRGPIVLPYPMLFEHKIMKSKKWRDCHEKGVREANPVYYYQMQTYMAYMELRYALFVAVDTDTSMLLVEQVPFVPGDAQWASDRGVAVLQASSPEELPRIAKDSTDFRCKWCDHKMKCWAVQAGPVQARPAWLA